MARNIKFTDLRKFNLIAKGCFGIPLVNMSNVMDEIETQRGDAEIK